MILKININREEKSSKIFISNIKEVINVVDRNTCLAYAGKDKYGFSHLGIFVQKNNIVNRSIIYPVDRMLLDESKILCQIDCTKKVDDSKDKNKYWNVSCYHIFYNNGTTEVIALMGYEEIFLMNDNGKIIERI